MLVAPVQLCWNLNDPALDPLCRRPTERFRQTGLLGWRVPIDHDEFDWDAKTRGLCSQSSYESLHPAMQIEAMIIITGRYNDG